MISFKAMIRLLKVAAVILMFSFFSNAKAKEQMEGGAYGFSFLTLVGQNPAPLSAYKGKVLLIVNTASKCGFTGQYEGLEKRDKNYQEKGLVIIGVPSNDFGGQEPASNSEIASFCKINYGVSFPMMAKEIVSGKNAHPFYKWAKDTLGFGTAPKWNFHKYLVSKDGKLVGYFHSNTSPDSKKLISAIEKELAKTN